MEVFIVMSNDPNNIVCVHEAYQNEHKAIEAARIKAQEKGIKEIDNHCYWINAQTGYEVYIIRRTIIDYEGE